MKKVSFIFIMATVIMAASVGSACTQKEPPDQVSVQLKWVHSVQFAGMYLAEQKGFYADDNIAVTFNEGGLKVDGIEGVTSRRNDFGIVNTTDVLQARVAGIDIKAIAVIFRINPTVFFAMADSGIETPEDFVSKKVRRGPSDFILPAMMSNLGIDMDQLQLMPMDLDMETFYSGEVDVWRGYLTDQVIAIRSKGYKLRIFYPDNYGVHIYNDIIITTARLIDENPGLVERFLRATLRGWRYAIENPDEAVAIALKYDDTLDKAHMELVMEAQAPLIHTGIDNIGYMRGDIWEEMYQLMFNHRILDAPLDPETVYTMEFLNKVYGIDQ